MPDPLQEDGVRARFSNALAVERAAAPGEAVAAGGPPSALEARVGRLHADYRLGLEQRRTQAVGDERRLATLAGDVAHTVRGAAHRVLRHSLGGRARHPLRITRNAIPIRTLDERLDGLAIAHLSDLFADREGSPIEVVAELLARQAFDVCVITGDFLAASTGTATARALARLERLLTSIETPCYAVLGDRDSLHLLPRLEALGLRVLVNESVAVGHGETRLYLGGVDDPHYYKADDVQATLQTIPAGATSILLAHSPEVFARAEQAGFDVMLSGHTLGARSALGGGLPLLGRSRGPRALCRGSWQYRSLVGYTSAGCGEPDAGARLRHTPEIALHTLQRGQARDADPEAATGRAARGR